MHFSGDDRFFFGVLNMVVSMMQEKEVNQSHSRNWLEQDAATPDMVKKAGTMRFDIPLIFPYYVLWI